MKTLAAFLLCAALVTGCQSSETSPSANKTVEPSKTAATKGDANKVSATSSDVDSAKLAEIARAAAEGKAAPSAPKTAALPSSPHDKAGFVTKVDDGRLWVFKKDAKELAEFIKHGELVKSVTRVGVGPNRMTVRAADAATIDAYLAASPATVNAAPAAAAPALPSSPHDKEGFVTKLDDGRLWVFKKDAKELAEFIKHGELVKSVTRVGAGPNRMTIRAADTATIDAYLAAGQ